MKVLSPGHKYELRHLDGYDTTVLQFVSRPPLNPKIQGVTNQEVLRALIDRVKHLDSELPWEGNTKIIYHLRMALGLHEARALLRHIEKDDMPIEEFPVGQDGHLIYKDNLL